VGHLAGLDEVTFYVFISVPTHNTALPPKVDNTAETHLNVDVTHKASE
jgi:hypothetical protein